MKDSKKNIEYAVYFLNLLASSLFYSYITTNLLEMNFSNSLFIVVLSSIASLIILGDTRYTRLLEKIQIRIFPILGLVIAIFLLIVSGKVNGIVLYLTAFFLMEIVVSVLLLVFQTTILKDEMSLTVGFLNMQLIRTIAVLFGFFIGTILGQLNYKNLFFYIFLVVIILNILATFNYSDKSKQIKEESTEKVKGIHFYFMIGFLSTSTVLWIPLLTKEFISEKMVTISWLPFVLPGVASMLFIILQKRRTWFFDSMFMELTFIPLFIIFIVSRFLGVFPIIQVVIFSIIVALSLSLGVRIRKTFLELNIKNNMKYILQSLTVSSAFISLFFSLLGTYERLVEVTLAILCMSCVCFMIIRRRDFK
ncbi:hypothetical protein EFL99_11435 [Lactococcus lactis]|uniref:hypothetical protein n=1 Tax=Lactococcus lactis TaxID=1358 RepID=UPI001F53B337|nr:hypothetical protein [Lactococcus lactis]MCI1072651.1 hypothetical protein [Lactococcus lactis]MCT1183829.1 hypothetical protein [Lactococcus lactis]